MQGRLFLWTGLSLALLVLCVTAGVSLGSAAIPVETVWAIIVNKLAPGTFEPTWSDVCTPANGCGTEITNGWLVRSTRCT